MKTLLLQLCLSLPCLTLHAAERVALIIGNDAYQHARPLETAVNDAKAVAGALQKLGFDTLSVSNAGLESMVEALDTLKSKAAGAKAVLVYYAGHGVESNGSNYLVPVDARLERELQLKTQAVSLETLLDEMKRMNVPARMVILDCCRDNPLEGRSWLATRSAGGGGLAALDQDTMNEATLVVYASSPGKPALDRVQDQDTHSPFTQALLDQLPQPGVHSFEVFGRVEENVIHRTAGRQKPRLFYNGSTLPFREFRFAKDAPPEAPPAVVVSAPPAPMPAPPTVVASSPPATIPAAPMPATPAATVVSAPPATSPEPTAAVVDPVLPPRGYFDLDTLYTTGPYASYNSYTRSHILSQAQDKLKAEGLYTSSSDGAPGPGTQRGLIAWQRLHGIPVTGRLDAATLQQMKLSGISEQQPPVVAKPTPRPQHTAARQPAAPPPASNGGNLDEQFRRAAERQTPARQAVTPAPAPPANRGGSLDDQFRRAAERFEQKR